MHILYVRPYPGEVEMVRQALPECTVTTTGSLADLSEAERSAVDIISVFVDYQLTAAELSLVPNCLFVATRSAGYDHIDVAAIKERGMTLSRVPHYGTRTVAEYAIALLFALSRNAFQSYTDLRENTIVPDLSVYEGFDVAGKTLGVIGTGAIGSNVCTLATGLGMDVVAYDVVPDKRVSALPRVRYVTLEALLARADVVTLHVPSLPQTKHLMNAERFALMKPGSYLINTARGDVVNTAALLAALESGQLAGAGLDVLEGEHELQEEADLLARGGVDAELWQQLVRNHVLIDLPNVIVTPHIAFNTVEAKREITEVTIANIKAWLQNAPQHTV